MESENLNEEENVNEISQDLDLKIKLEKNKIYFKSPFDKEKSSHNSRKIIFKKNPNKNIKTDILSNPHRNDQIIGQNSINKKDNHENLNSLPVNPHLNQFDFYNKYLTYQDK